MSNQIQIATLTETERNFLNNLFADDVVTTKAIKPFTAKLNPETLTLLTELDIVENGTAIYRFFQMACKAKKELVCETAIDEGEFDVITFRLKNNSIKLALPVFVQNKLNLMPKKVLNAFKTKESAKFKLMRRFYREANDERIIDLIFDVTPPDTSKKA